eukprot:1156802-Pelagomonas_calceolata.AAC.7
MSACAFPIPVVHAVASNSLKHTPVERVVPLPGSKAGDRGHVDSWSPTRNCYHAVVCNAHDAPHVSECKLPRSQWQQLPTRCSSQAQYSALRHQVKSQPEATCCTLSAMGSWQSRCSSTRTTALPEWLRKTFDFGSWAPRSARIWRLQEFEVPGRLAEVSRLGSNVSDVLMMASHIL